MKAAQMASAPKRSYNPKPIVKRTMTALNIRMSYGATTAPFARTAKVTTTETPINIKLQPMIWLMWMAISIAGLPMGRNN